MSCLDMTCPELNCDGDELISYKDDECCPYCQRDWVEVTTFMNQGFLNTDLPCRVPHGTL